MTNLRYVISVKDGLHARNAMELSRAASGYKSNITLQKENGRKVDCKNVISLMSLGASQGDVVILSAEGEDEETAIGYLEGFLRVVL